jgi:transposase-like protein
MSTSASHVPGEDVGRSSHDGTGDRTSRPVRRSFTTEYRARIVAEYEAAPRGKKSVVLRREGLNQSQIREWGFALGRGGSRDGGTAPTALPNGANSAISHESDR